MKNTELKLGLQPFWFWNGDMKEEEIVRQILDMKQKGVPGFLIHPRQGMEIPYMSKEFFDRVRLAVKTAKENDMEVWLYDEYPYPSGICGGEVILDHPEYLCKRLQRVVKEADASEHVRLFAPWGRVILARAYLMDKDGRFDLDRYIDLTEYVGTGYQQEIFQYSGLTRYNKKRFFTGDAGKLLSWTAPESGRWKIYFVTETVLKHFKYFENYIDTLNPDAIRYFIQLTHERYKENVGEEFGKTIKGFFTDEITAFPDKEPWSPLLPGKVLARHGIDLIRCLPALWEDLGEISSQVRYAYWETACDCFIESYDKAVYEWCDQNGLLYIGEKPILRSRELKYVHIPGIDAGHQKAGSAVTPIAGRYRSNGRLVRSAAHFYDKPAALCEVGHSIGWGMTMQDLKLIFDWLAVEGIDFFVIHGFFYTTDALRKHDAPPSAFFQMPWWEDASCLSAYAAQLSRCMRSFRRGVNTLVMDPVTSCWTSGREDERLLREDFAKLQNAILKEGLDYYIIDPELFAEGSVQKTQEGTFFIIHGEAYETLLLPPMRNLEAAACRKLLEFAKAGGRIGALSCFPFEKIEPSDAVLDLNAFFGLDAPSLWKAYKNGQPLSVLQKGSLYLAPDTESLIRWLKQPGQANTGCCKQNASWQLIPLDGLGNNGLFYTQGQAENGVPALFVVNTLPKDRTLRVCHPDGRIGTLKLDAFASRFLDKELPAEESPLTLFLNQEMEMRLTDANALRLGEWTMTLPDGQSHRVDCAPVIDQLSAGGFLRPVLQKKYFGCPKELEPGETQADYKTEFFCSKTFLQSHTPVSLVMEPGTFLGEWFLSLNGRDIAETDFQEKRFYLRTNLAADVTGLLRAGKNLLTVKIHTDLSYGGMRNPLYLFGSFGVEALENCWELCPLPALGNPMSLKDSDLPFYYGEAVFTAKLPSDSLNRDTVVIKLTDQRFGDSVRLQAEDYITAPCAFRPYLFELPGAILRRQKGELKIRIRNTAIGLFEGQYYDPETDTYLPIRPVE